MSHLQVKQYLSNHGTWKRDAEFDFTVPSQICGKPGPFPLQDWRLHVMIHHVPCSFCPCSFFSFSGSRPTVSSEQLLLRRLQGLPLPCSARDLPGIRRTNCFGGDRNSSGDRPRGLILYGAMYLGWQPKRWMCIYICNIYIYI